MRFIRSINRDVRENLEFFFRAAEKSAFQWRPLHGWLACADWNVLYPGLCPISTLSNWITVTGWKWPVRPDLCIQYKVWLPLPVPSTVLSVHFDMSFTLLLSLSSACSFCFLSSPLLSSPLLSSPLLSPSSPLLSNLNNGAEACCWYIFPLVK